MSKMKKNRKKLFAILLQAALVSTAMTMPAYAAKTPGIGSDALVGDDATGPVLTGGNTEVEEETSPYTKEQLEDGTLEYGEIAWRIEGYNSTYLNLRSSSTARRPASRRELPWRQRRAPSWKMRWT